MWMTNQVDLRRYKCLKALSRIPTANKLDKYRKKYIKEVECYMEGSTWEELHKLGYVTSDPDIHNIKEKEKKCEN